MHFVILAALAANLGSMSFANDGAGPQKERRSYSMDGRRWVTLFHGDDERSVKHLDSVVSQATTIRGREYFEVLQTGQNDLTRWTVDLGATEGFGRVQSMNESAPSNLEIPSATPWVDVEVRPDPPASEDMTKPIWGPGEARRQKWRENSRAYYEESFTIALGLRDVTRVGRETAAEMVRVQSFYRQRVRQSRIEMLVGNPDAEGRFTRLVIERNGVSGTLDLASLGVRGEILGFSASGDHERVFVTTTHLARFAFDVGREGSQLVFSRGGLAEEVPTGLVAKPVSRAVKVEAVSPPEKPSSPACDDSLTEDPALAAE